jgi:putative membrane protein
MSYPDMFQDKPIELTGFVYREPDYANDELVLARYRISCCIADATVIGIFAKGAEVQNYATDSWIDVKGSIQLRTENGIKSPYIHLESEHPTKAPKTPYIY